MAKVNPISGSRIYIGGATTAKNAVDLSDFSTKTWKEIGGWANAGGLGDPFEIGTQTLINESRTQKFKTVQQGSSMENQFVPVPGDAGQAEMRVASNDRCNHYAFKVEWAGCQTPETATISIADPAVVTLANHGLNVGDAVIFGTTGALPSPLVAGTVYYVKTAPTTGTFTVAATLGGTAISTDGGSQSGTHTVSRAASLTQYFNGIVNDTGSSGGDASAAYLRGWTIDTTSNIVEI